MLFLLTFSTKFAIINREISTLNFCTIIEENIHGET